MGRPVGWEVLGLGGDPTPGDPLAVVGVARLWGGVADDAEVAERGVRSLVSDGAVLAWVGAAGEVFRGAVGEFPEQLRRCKESYRLGAQALVGWAVDLEVVQGVADRALVLGREAAADLVVAREGLGRAQGRASSVDRVASDLMDRAGAPAWSAGPVVVPSGDAVRLAHREAVATRAGVVTARSVVVDASERLAAARVMALDAASLRDERARVVAGRVHEAAGVGIASRSVWESFRDGAAKVWDIAVVVAKVVVAVLGVVVLIIGGPLAWVVFAAALLVLADTLAKYSKGEASGWDVLWALVACIPATKGITTLGGLLKGARTLAGVRSVGETLILAREGGRLAGMLLCEPTLALRQFASNPSIRLQRMALQVRHMSPINALSSGVEAYRAGRVAGNPWWKAATAAEDARYWGFGEGYRKYVRTHVASTDPARAAQLLQGGQGYSGVDQLRNHVFNPGDCIVTSGPGSQGWAVRFDGLAESVDVHGNVAANAYSASVQVGPNMIYHASPLRNELHVFVVKEEFSAGTGHALANPQFGPGGAPQLWSPVIDNHLLATGGNQYLERIGSVQAMENFKIEDVSPAVATQGEAVALRRAIHAPWRSLGYFQSGSPVGE